MYVNSVLVKPPMLVRLFMSADGEMQPGAMDLIEPVRRSPAVRRDALRRRRDSARRREGTCGVGDEMGKTKGEAVARDDDGFFDSVMATGTCHGPRRDGDEMPQEQGEATALDDDGFFDSVMATATWRENAVPTSSAGQPAPRDSADGSAQESAHPAPFKTLFELRHWLEHLPVADRRTVPVCRICDALHVLELDPSRDTQRQLRALSKSWGIKRRSSGKDRQVWDLHHRLVDAVLVEGNRLRTVGRSLGSLSKRAIFGKMFRNRSDESDEEISGRVRSRSPRL